MNYRYCIWPQAVIRGITSLGELPLLQRGPGRNQGDYLRRGITVTAGGAQAVIRGITSLGELPLLQRGPGRNQGDYLRRGITVTARGGEQAVIRWIAAPNQRNYLSKGITVPREGDYLPRGITSLGGLPLLHLAPGRNQGDYISR